MKGIQQAISFIEAGQLQQAVQLLSDHLKESPKDWEAWARLGEVQGRLQDWKSAEDAYVRAAALNPRWAPLLCNLGMASLHQRNFSRALTVFKRAEALDNQQPEVYNGIGVALKAANRYRESVEAFEKALALAPGDVDCLCNLGNACVALRDFARAHQAYDRMLELQPGNARALFGKALAHLVCGEYREGFALYESRWETEQRDHRRRFEKAAWDGEADLNGRTLLVYCEQGLGDAIQFVRFVPSLTAKGARVLLEVPPALVELCRTLVVQGDFTVYAEKTAPASYDMVCALLSLPGLLGTTLDTIPAVSPYLFSDPDRRDAWKEELKGAAIGLVAAGNPKHKNDFNRSIPLPLFRPLLEKMSGRLCLLSKDVPLSDAQFLSQYPRVVQVGRHFSDFADTAAAVAGLDLVITVDTSVAHLAGALGKPVWLLLPYPPDWRWLLDRPDSPWYPTMRIFRQPTPGDWDAVLKQVMEALESLRKA